MTATNRQLALLRSLRSAKGRRESGLFLVEGLRLCDELARSGFPTELVVMAEGRAAEPCCRALMERFRRKGATVAVAPDRRVERISDTVHGQGVLAAARWKDRDLADLPLPAGARVLALDRVSDPGNAGTIVRTAAWFGAAAVILGEGCADLLNPKTVRATMGGLFHLPVFRNVALGQAARLLKEDRGCAVFVAGTAGDPTWWRWVESARSLLVLGSEAHGVGEEIRALAEKEFSIPRLGRGESLNVAVAAGVFLSALAAGKNANAR